MRPISQTTTQKLSHCRRDDATLYASLELSQATWLVTSLSPGSEKMSKHSTLREDRSRSSSFRKPGSTASGFTDCSAQMVSKATWLIPRRLPCHGVGGEQRRTLSTARRC